MSVAKITESVKFREAIVKGSVKLLENVRFWAKEFSSTVISNAEISRSPKVVYKVNAALSG